jgi:hypothetical protein
MTANGIHALNLHLHSNSTTCADRAVRQLESDETSAAKGSCVLLCVVCEKREFCRWKYNLNFIMESLLLRSACYGLIRVNRLSSTMH